jgi:hypothetical protein
MTDILFHLFFLTNTPCEKSEIICDQYTSFQKTTSHIFSSVIARFGLSLAVRPPPPLVLGRLPAHTGPSLNINGLPVYTHSSYFGASDELLLTTQDRRSGKLAW